MTILFHYLEAISIISLIWYILLAVGLWKTFEKAGIAGWKAIVPIYNFYLLFKISWQPTMFWYWLGASILGSILLSMTNSTGFLFYIGTALNLVSALMLAVLWYNVSLAYGHGIGYFIGLYFLNPIFIMILGFGASQYQGNRYDARLG